ncbi:hypothetical protein [Salinispora oceanensis]|uniref:hypothetical protein n=1 Tax=Salinispora oceanensis TaxID=1050199 RepID=UPI0003A6293D|nr:hypothetical protein [Salinispora oceanensis]
MTLADVTRDGVLAAVQEFDRVGRQTYLKATGFGRARAYYLDYEGRLYDSKAIVGYAHGISTGVPWAAKRFTGGDKSVAQRLEVLGFTVAFLPNPNWTRDEIILACELVEANGWRQLDAQDERVKSLSELLQSPAIHSGRRNPDFRNPAGVALKTYNIVVDDSNSNQLDKLVREEFRANPAEMKKEADRIRESLLKGSESQSQREAEPRQGEKFSAHQNRADLGALPRPAARVPLVLIAPCYGNPASRARFDDTLAVEVPFMEGPIREALAQAEFEALLQLHPGGAARFWGALGKHDSKMDRLATTDPILFTGDNRVQAIGRVGCRIRNTRLANLLWEPDTKTGGWSNVYSVLEFQRVQDLTYSDIQVLAGYSPNDVFQETRVPNVERSTALIVGLGLNATPDEAEKDVQAERKLLEALGGRPEVFEAEAMHTESAEYQRSVKTVTVRRVEARLMARYRDSLPTGQGKRLRLAVGWTDLYDLAGADLIEAKRSASHRYVRDALGQLLDYAAHTSQPIDRLTALFPESPAEADVRLLHIYGIDCLYWAGGQEFERLEAPAEARERIRAAWSAASLHS